MTDLPETILTGILTGLAADALWESGKWAWKNRNVLYRKQVLASATMEGKGTVGATGRVVKDADLRWKVHSRLSKDADLRWRVEAPTPSLARRLEDVAVWYLHVS
jgi:hypothetical protein